METKHEVCSAFTPRRNSLRKSCADIIREARQSLRVQSTQRPFTPRDGPRRLFGANSVRRDHGSRPPSAFRLGWHGLGPASSSLHLLHHCCLQKHAQMVRKEKRFVSTN
uniref:Uncharacterized protein n=1 Tax=Xiphophorus couchianus TaxID=32473 RepID=A0A3B5L5A9_9TELE